ncbi:hypothetical protein [Dryocola sp. BD586]|uniref:hypothetical protein n=1 Tax=Dryocola sp. BD586 TaxID=3133271 RepID=UPI003F501585
MTTDIVVRYAKDIQRPNEIANFNRRYGISSESISAISWEKPFVSRSNYSLQLLKAMIATLVSSTHMKLFVMIEMSARQPKSAIVKYKKIWGLLENEGLHLDAIINKQEYLLDVGDGLVLGGVAIVDFNDDETLRIFLERDDYVYFSLLRDDLPIPMFEDEFVRSSWPEFVWNNNGVILFPMGYIDESSCEIVAMGHERDIARLL